MVNTEEVDPQWVAFQSYQFFVTGATFLITTKKIACLDRQWLYLEY